MEQDALASQVIDRQYRVVRVLGQGATGMVFEARALSDGAAVAIKVLHGAFLENRDALRRFEREASSIARLDHPHVVRILGTGADEGRPYLVMELLAGRSLAHILRAEGALPFARVARLMRQVLAALEAVHAEGLIHRDLKPSNIVVLDGQADSDGADFVKVCDFGLAKTVAVSSDAGDTFATTGGGALCGTPEYMAPEQILGDRVDGAADAYAAAVMLYQLVTGELPFREASPWGVLARQLRDAPQPPSARRPDLFIPLRLEQLILRGLAKDRNRRASVAELSAELEALACADWARLEPALSRSEREGVPSTILERPAGAPTAPPPRPRRALPRVLAGAGALAAVVGVWLATGWPRPAPGASAAATREAARPPVAPPAAVAAPVPPPALAARQEHARPAPELVPARAARAHARGRSERAPEGAAPVAPPLPAPSAPPAPTLATAEKLQAAGPPEEACKLGEELKARSPESPALHRFLGQCYMRLGQVARAKQSYREYLRLAPNAPDARFVAGIVADIRN